MATTGPTIAAPPLTPTSRAPSVERSIARVAMELVASGSLEMGAHRPGDAVEIAALLPSGTPVFVNHLPRHALDDTLGGLIATRAAGLEPVPHLAARRIASRAEAVAFLARAVGEAGVKKVLLIGGDTAGVAGPYADAGALLADGVVAEAGIREVALAAYPEGHPRIPSAALTAAVAAKLAMAKAQGLGVSILTQFSFNPSRIIELSVALERSAPGVPVYVGLAGPTSPRTLLKYAQVCGVSASLRALSAQGFAAARLVTHTDPGDQLSNIARHVQSGGANNIVGVHIFSFGGVRLAAGWINAVIRAGA